MSHMCLVPLVICAERGRALHCMEASTFAGVEGSEDCTTSAPSHWSKLVDKYSDIFKSPGMPAEHDIVHKIELKPGSQPPYQW